MANFREAYDAVDKVFDTLTESHKMRPHSAGIISMNGGFGLKVVLPRKPASIPPVTLFGVPIEYHVAETEPVLLGGAAPAWLVESRKRRSGG